jgi:drug/metabolite transporter (DMT)-like permease
VKRLLSPGALVVLWSSGFIGAELGTRLAPASTLLAWRYLVAAVLLAAVCCWRRERIGRAGLGRQVVLGLLCQVAYLGLTVGGVGQGASAGTTSLIASLQPLVVVALAAAVLSERARLAQLLGLGLGLVGVVLVVGGDLTTGDVAWWVYLLPVGGMLALSFGTVLQQRWEAPEPVLVALTIQTVTAAAVFWTYSAVEGTTAPPASPAFWGAVAWVVVLSSFGGYGMYLHVSQKDGATRASTWLYLTPPTTMLWAAVMFGDPVTALGLVGLAVSGVGVAAALVRRSSCRDARCRRSRRRSRMRESSRSRTTRRERSPRAGRCPSRAPAG